MQQIYYHISAEILCTLYQKEPHYHSDLVYYPVQKVSNFIFSRKNPWQQVGKSDHIGEGDLHAHVWFFAASPGVSFSPTQLVCDVL
jgi:hypothetical protein